MNKVTAGFFSFTEVTDPSEHRSYNRWHQLDHMPEQFPLPGIAFGQRWVSTPACTAARAVSRSPLDVVHYMTLYLMTEPLDETLESFYALGARLRAEGRFHLQRRSHLSGPFDVLSIAAAPRVLVSAEAVPYRPNRGVYVLVEEPLATPVGRPAVLSTEDERHSDLVAVDGVAGVWAFASPGRERITVCYLDGDPATVAADVAGILPAAWEGGEYRPLLAGAFETVTPWQWDWFEAP